MFMYINYLTWSEDNNQGNIKLLKHILKRAHEINYKLL